MSLSKIMVSLAFQYVIWSINTFELLLFGDFEGIKSGLWLLLRIDTHTVYLAYWVEFTNTESVFSAPGQLAINHRLKGSEPVQELFCFVSYVVLWTFAVFTFNSFDQIGWSLGNIFETYNSTWPGTPQNSFSGLSKQKRIACGNSPEKKLK